MEDSIFRFFLRFKYLIYQLEIYRSRAKSGCSEDQLNSNGIPRIDRMCDNPVHYVSTKDQPEKEWQGAHLLECGREHTPGERSGRATAFALFGRDVRRAD
jgi:hypothetical protein